MKELVAMQQHEEQWLLWTQSTKKVPLHAKRSSKVRKQAARRTRTRVAKVTLADLVGCRGFTHIDAFLGPKSWNLLANLSHAFSPKLREPYSVQRKALNATGVADVVAVAMSNDIEELWHCLVDPKRPPTQEEIDLALQWTLLFPMRSQMAELLKRYGGKERATPSKAGRTPNAAVLPDNMDPSMLDDILYNENERGIALLPAGQAITHNICQDLRVRTLKWLMQAAVAMSFGDTLVAGAIATFDRYCEVTPERVEWNTLHCLALAALSIEMKSSPEEAECADRVLVLEHLAQRQVPLKQIHTLECRVWRRLDYNVAAAPCPLRLLRTMCARLCDPLPALGLLDEDSAKAWRSLAHFVTELSIFNAPLHYRWAPLVLATGALGVALMMLAASDASLQSRRKVLHDGVCSSFAEVSQIGSNPAAVASTVRSAEAALLMHWVSCAQGDSRWTDAYWYLCGKYARRNVPSLLSAAAGLGAADLSSQDVWTASLVRTVENFERFYGASLASALADQSCQPACGGGGVCAAV